MDSSDPSVPIESEWPANHESYELLGKIGYGAFATVWRGKNLLNGQPCAIKIIDLESIDTNFVGKYNFTPLLNPLYVGISKYLESNLTVHCTFI